MGGDGHERMMREFGQREGVVLSGGGAKGAYEVGVLKALVLGESPATGGDGLDPDIYTGTSVGAYNAAFMVSRAGGPPSDAILELERLWLERIASKPTSCGNGVFRLRAPLQILEPGCFARPLDLAYQLADDGAFYSGLAARTAARLAASSLPLAARALQAVNLEALISAEALGKLVEETIDLGGLRRSSKMLTIAAADWVHGALRLFSREEIADPIGHAGILASAALPGIFPPVEIEGDLLVDGGLLLNTPLKPALRQGARVVYLVYLDPLLAESPPEPDRNTLDVIYRAMSIIWAARVASDLRQANRINRGLRILRRSDGPALGAEGQTLHRAIADLAALERRLGRGERPRYLEVHIFRPKEVLGGGLGLIDFSSSHIRRLLEQGRHDAKEHDCTEMGCLLGADGRGPGRRESRRPRSLGTNRPGEGTR